jgi:hypothetical protein
VIFLPADIILTARVGLLDDVIQALQRSPGEARSRVAHVAGVSYGGTLHKAQIIEALGQGTIERPLVKYATQDVSAGIYRMPGLSDIERVKVVRMARSFVGRPYGYFKLLLHALRLDGLLRTGKAPICSQVWAEAYSILGVRFMDKRPDVVQPDDIWDHVTAGNGWEAVGVI